VVWPQNHRVPWLIFKTKTEGRNMTRLHRASLTSGHDPSDRWTDLTGGAYRSFEAEDTWCDRKLC
jgi:hypothetical protein